MREDRRRCLAAIRLDPASRLHIDRTNRRRDTSSISVIDERRSLPHFGGGYRIRHCNFLPSSYRIRNIELSNWWPQRFHLVLLKEAWRETNPLVWIHRAL